ncbi:hypothetical protein FHX45_003972 [Amycolatopsis granulosa]|nr:hypothetical protein [Amycolatopsis granulosa]
MGADQETREKADEPPMPTSTTCGAQLPRSAALEFGLA